jgi:hypothetical protein
MFEMKTMTAVCIAAMLTCVLATGAVAQNTDPATGLDMGQSADKYVGYYYPSITSSEVFDRQLQVTPPANRDIRIEFVTLLSLSQRDAPYPARYVAFAKGDGAQTLIITALEDGAFKTLYRARAAMARATSNMRATEFFIMQGLQFNATFYDMLQILEFNRLILTDGETWAHQVQFARPN